MMMNYRGLFVGLGNPGPKYKGTRHNCGFMLIQLLLGEAREEGQVEELNGKKFNSLLWRVRHPSLRGTWLAAMPQTFMNDSGRAVQPLLAWHNLGPSQLVVIHDELDIPAGALRFRFGGGLAGHRGLTSIAQCAGSRDFYRLRIGIGKPADKSDMLDWVLGRPDPADHARIDEALPEALETLFIFSNSGLAEATRFAHAVYGQIMAGEAAK